jgi:hypothetical protein
MAVRSPRLAPAVNPATERPAPATAAPSAQPVTYKKPPLSAGVKVAIAVILALLVVLLAMAIVGKMGTNKELDTYNRLVKLAAEEDAKDIPVGQKKVPVTKDELAILLNAAVDVGANQARVTILHALWWANATDGTNVDAAITEFATKRMMADDIRVSLIRDVLSKRKNPAVVPILMEFCRSTNDTNAAIAAIQACRFMASDAEFPKYLDIVGFNPNPNIRQAAEENVVEILRKSANHEALGSKVSSALAGATTDEAKYALTRLLGPAGGPKAAEIVKKALTSPDKKEQLAAAVALGTWADDSMFKTLMDFLEPLSDEQLRPRVFDAGFRFLTLPDRKRSPEANEDFWKLLARNAKLRAEQEKVIRGLANNETDEWAVSIVEYFVAESKDDNVIDLAEKALDRMRERARLKEGDKPDDKPDAKPSGESDAKSDEKPDADATKDSNEDSEPAPAADE